MVVHMRIYTLSIFFALGSVVHLARWIITCIVDARFGIWLAKTSELFEFDGFGSQKKLMSRCYFCSHNLRHLWYVVAEVRPAGAAAMGRVKRQGWQAWHAPKRRCFLRQKVMNTLCIHNLFDPNTTLTMFLESSDSKLCHMASHSTQKLKLTELRTKTWGCGGPGNDKKNWVALGPLSRSLMKYTEIVWSPYTVDIWYIILYT